MDILDEYVTKPPHEQSVLDMFSGEWSSMMPQDSGLVTAPGNARLFDDDRIRWCAEVFGGVSGLDILELGPLEAGHSFMLSRMGAKAIVSIEANTRAFLKCLCIKEIFDLRNVSFKLGDFVQFLEATTSRYDLVVASGVLYHMTDPIRLLSSISAVTDRVFLWTHYYDEDIIRGAPALAGKFGPLEARTYQGLEYLASEQSYKEALSWTGFCGGPRPTSTWLARQSIMEALRYLDLTNIEIAFDHPRHPNGPSLAICASR